MVSSKQKQTAQSGIKRKEKKKMINKIKTNPAFAAAFYFILTWVGFPVAALAISLLRGITFAAAASTPYLLVIFPLGSIISAIQMYFKTKNPDR